MTTMDAITAPVPVAHPLASRYASIFWDCSLTRLERWIAALRG